MSILTYQLLDPKVGKFIILAGAVYSWKSLQDFLIKNLSLKNSTQIRYFFTKQFIENY